MNRELDRTALTVSPWRTIVALLIAIAAVAAAGLLASPASADGVTREKLEAHGWTCIVPRHFRTGSSASTPDAGGRFLAIPILHRRTAHWYSARRQESSCSRFT